MKSFPVNFEALAKSGGNPASGGYPYQIRGADLMSDFVHAALDVDDDLVEETTGQGGHPQRKLKIEPGNNTDEVCYWDGSKYTTLAKYQGDREVFLSGELEWKTSLPDAEKVGTLLQWNADERNWEPGPFANFTGQIIFWNATEKKWMLSTHPTLDGEFLQWDLPTKNWVPFKGGAEGAFPQWDATDGWSSAGAGTANGELLRWNSASAKWEPFGRGTNQNQLLMWGENGWQAAPPPPATGKYVFGSVDGVLTWIATEEC
jgi:hypothetical protein